MKSTNSNNGVKMVMVAGMLVREDQVEGRLKSLAQGRHLKNLLANDQLEEDKRLADEGYSPSEIACLRHSNRIARMTDMGLGTSTRVKRVRKKA